MALVLMSGCGGGASADGAGDGGFTFTGKISTAGNPVQGVSVKLFQSSFSIYSTSVNGVVYYGTRDTAGVESVASGSLLKTVTTNEQGVYSFTGLQSGKYTILPVAGTYVYNWPIVPSKSDIGVITVTQSGMVYLYNPDGENNILSSDGSAIYNTGVPFMITDNVLMGLDFEATLSGGVGIQF
ncbi:MAG: SpaA isopeptide-forming pilin-related protein [Desulfuromonadaceae bacterium]|nr:SpaA isopeptide-forming pilin-related protein [Desulfuromonadaceae bacterium]